MRKMSILIGICVTLIIVCALTAFVALEHEYVSGASADITKDQARQIALQDAGETLEEVTFTRSALEKENDRLVYLIDFYTDNISYHYRVDGMTGTIYRSDTQAAPKPGQVREVEPEQTQTSGTAAGENTGQDGSGQDIPGQNESEQDKSSQDISGQDKSGQDISGQNKSGQTAAQPDDALTYIGVERAKAIALEDAGLDGKDVQFEKVKLEHEDNLVIYDVEFEYGKIEYDYDLDAVSGAIVDKDVEIDDD